MLLSFFFFVCLFCYHLVTVAARQYPCLPLGPSFSPPQALSSSKVFAAALKKLGSTIQTSLNGGSSDGKLDPNATSFSIDVWSLHQERSLYSHHFSAPDLNHNDEGVHKVNSDTVYRLGSMSKLFAVYTFLLAAGDMEFRQPVTKYVPELAAYATQHRAALSDNTIDYVDWNSITVEALASQMSGISRDFAFGPQGDMQLAALGLPPVPPVNSSFCGPDYFVQTPCKRAGKLEQSVPQFNMLISLAFFSNFFSQHPSVPSFHTPAYSNSAYQILSYALESIIGKPFPAIVQSVLIDPLNLHATFTTAPPSSNFSIVPYNNSWSAYGWDVGDEAPAAGYYSSINDLRVIGKAMLNSTLIPPHMTRRWIQPISFTSDPNVAVGSPWEIFRAPTNTSTWMYTKGGHLGNYATEIILIPDLEIGFTVLTAGAMVSNDVDLLSALLTNILVPAAEEAAREEARSTYAGTYTYISASKSKSNTKDHLTITVDQGPGLVISNWTYNSTDATALVAEIALGAPDIPFEIRLWPTTLKATGPSKTSSKTNWRAVVQPLPIVDHVFLGKCISWFQIDQLSYGGVALDEFEFVLENGRAVEVVPRAWRAGYSR